jgi:hypothetical protein
MNEWRKSTRCGTNACVEVAMPFVDERGPVRLRDSEAPDSILTFDQKMWRAFIKAVSA